MSSKIFVKVIVNPIYQTIMLRNKYLPTGVNIWNRMYVLKAYSESFESNVKFVKLCSHNHIYILSLDCLEAVETVRHGEFVICTNNCICHTIYISGSQKRVNMCMPAFEVGYHVQSAITVTYLNIQSTFPFLLAFWSK